MKDYNKISELRIKLLVETLRNTNNGICNDWNTKERENFIFKEIMKLDFILDGNSIKKNKKVIKKIKEYYLLVDIIPLPIEIIEEYFPKIEEGEIYLIYEPFGSKASPDFLLISKNGVIGIEDKSSNNGKITFNTGTPGGNKIIVYYDRSEKKVYLITGERWFWCDETEKNYREFCKQINDIAKIKWEEKFEDTLPYNDFYSRPMLIDKKKIKDIANPDGTDVINKLKKYI
jgi:hypothetical protein